jgi:transglutaminase-like putative cysteine protease
VKSRFDDTRTLEQNLAKFEALVWRRIGDPSIVAIADRLRARGNTTDRAWVASRLHDWVSAFTYLAPPKGVELYVDPLLVIQRGGGDCDNLTGLLIALAVTSGIAARAVVLKTGPTGGHMYPELAIGGRWIAYDPCVTTPPPGHPDHAADGERVAVVEFTKRPNGIAAVGVGRPTMRPRSGVRP